MSIRPRHRLVVAVGVIAMTLLALIAPAAAHDPIFLSDDQTTPDTGPFMPDGTISWALYGQVLGDGDTRGFEFDLRDGDELFVGLLIPNLEPETALADGDLPVMTIERPDGSSFEVTANQREIFDEPFTKTSYVNLVEVREPAIAGRYRGVVTGPVASRFSVAIGETELFFTETSRAGERPTSFIEIGPPLQAWYTTPPGGEPSGELADGEAEVDLDLLDEAMESGAGALAEGVDEDVAMAETEDEAMAADEAMVEDDAVAEAPEADASTEAPADDASDDAAVDEVAVAASDSDGDGGSSATWVAPVVIAVLGAGLALFLRGRKDGSNA